MKLMSLIMGVVVVLFVNMGWTSDVGAETLQKNAPGLTPYIQAVQSPSYRTATAHDPHFDDASLWPADAKKSDYYKQAWPKSRVLVWAKPGQGVKDGWEAKYWLEDGKPATKPFDADTDLVFPDAPAGMCWTSLTLGRKYQPAAFRHLTIGKGTCIVGHFSAGANVWIKAGASVQFMDSMVGAKNTFVRNDNGDIRLVDHFHLSKAPTASVEMIGKFSSDDNWRMNSGILIVAPGSEIYAGNRTDPQIMEKATLVLLSGSYFTRRLNIDWGYDLIVDGKLMAGLPDRPLISDARLGLGYKSKGQFLGTNGGGRTPGPNDYGMLVSEGGSVTVHTSDPAKARLAIFCNKQENDWGQLDIISRGHPLHGDALVAKMKTLLCLTDMMIKGKVTWSGIRLDDMLKGGIHVLPVPPLGGANAPAFGDSNAGKPAELFTPIAVTKAGK